MTVSMPTTRLSLVMTGCGGKLTTCSRRSMSGRSRSMNGTTTLSPACSVRWYRPNRSTMPARACGTIRTDRTTANMASTDNQDEKDYRDYGAHHHHLRPKEPIVPR